MSVCPPEITFEAVSVSVSIPQTLQTTQICIVSFSFTCGQGRRSLVPLWLFARTTHQWQIQPVRLPTLETWLLTSTSSIGTMRYQWPALSESQDWASKIRTHIFTLFHPGEQQVTFLEETAQGLDCACHQQWQTMQNFRNYLALIPNGEILVMSSWLTALLILMTWLLTLMSFMTIAPGADPVFLLTKIRNNLKIDGNLVSVLSTSGWQRTMTGRKETWPTAMAAPSYYLVQCSGWSSTRLLTLTRATEIALRGWLMQPNKQTLYLIYIWWWVGCKGIYHIFLSWNKIKHCIQQKNQIARDVNISSVSGAILKWVDLLVDIFRTLEFECGTIFSAPTKTLLWSSA